MHEYFITQLTYSNYLLWNSTNHQRISFFV